MIGGVVFDNTQHITPRKIDIQTDQSTDINQLVCFAPTTGSSDINTDNRLIQLNDGTLTATKFVGNVESVGIISVALLNLLQAENLELILMLALKIKELVKHLLLMPILLIILIQLKLTEQSFHFKVLLMMPMLLLLLLKVLLILLVSYLRFLII